VPSAAVGGKVLRAVSAECESLSCVSRARLTVSTVCGSQW